MAQQLPADCSAAAAPTQPLEVSVNGTRFTPKSIRLSRMGIMTSGDDQFQTYRLTLRSEDAISSPLEADVAVVVRKGQMVDGKIFRRLPVKETGKQPLAAGGLPEVQGWSFRSRPANLTFNHVRYLGSVRLEFGKRQGRDDTRQRLPVYGEGPDVNVQQDADFGRQLCHWNFPGAGRVALGAATGSTIVESGLPGRNVEAR